MRQFEKGLPETEVEMSEVQDETACEGHSVVERCGMSWWNAKYKNGHGEYEITFASKDYEKTKAVEKFCQAIIDKKINGNNAADILEWIIKGEPMKHGRWIPTGMSNSTGPIVRCSACGQYINPSGTAIDLNRQKLEPMFCEKCGARMDGE